MKLSAGEKQLVAELTLHYEQNMPKLQTFLEGIQSVLLNSKELALKVHSFKWRLKEPSHLRGKLERKILDAKVRKKQFNITKENLFIKINDLVGVRILHLYSEQIESIDGLLAELFGEAQYNIIEGPFARTWDDEMKRFYDQIGIKTRASGPSMYTSVHYVIDSNSKTRFTAEIQVRTLAEELWGEVAHVIDYPIPCGSLACREQLTVLAKVASSCTRLVDSIFRSNQEFNTKKAKLKNVNTGLFPKGR